jgi:hypothetical protein
MRTVNTKLAKQLSSYSLIVNDFEFSAKSFGLASRIPVRTPDEVQAGMLSAEDRAGQLWQFEPLLRVGAAVAQFDGDQKTDNETMKAALFEAGVVTYGRCFNSGHRTSLRDMAFVGPLAVFKETHKLLIAIRNKHVAHTELKEEHSIVGCQLVEDPKYGVRPSMVMGIVSGRRYYPSDARLVELQDHCNGIIELCLRPKLIELSKTLREQLLQMPAEQISKMPEFESSPIPQDRFF